MYNKLTWSPPLDTGETLITGYLVEYQHPAISSITNRTIVHNTEHVICKLRVNGQPRVLNVDVRGINKVGHGLRSNTIQVSFFSEFALVIKLRYPGRAFHIFRRRHHLGILEAWGWGSKQAKTVELSLALETYGAKSSTWRLRTICDWIKDKLKGKPHNFAQPLVKFGCAANKIKERHTCVVCLQDHRAKVALLTCLALRKKTRLFCVYGEGRQTGARR